MKPWLSVAMPSLSTTGPELRMFDSVQRKIVPLVPSGPARMYVCGITPYDSTHLGHAMTYLTFDLANRVWRNAAHEVRYVQNITDVDDPLLERANETGQDWVELADAEISRFRGDMEALRILPPDHYIGAVEAIPTVLELIAALQSAGAIYQVEEDYYFDVSKDPAFGSRSGLDHDEMVRVFAMRGGDPQRPGKRHQLDCLVWRGQRPGEPSWPSPYGPGRPGWHIECTAIAASHLGQGFDLQGGGSDLIFPHHEMCAAEAEVADPQGVFAKSYGHVGMVGWQGEKMSKSKGNLVFVSQLRADGVDPMAIRLALLAHHYRTDWEWFAEDLMRAEDRLRLWRTASASGHAGTNHDLAREVLAALADDLDSPRALMAIDRWAETILAESTRTDHDGGTESMAGATAISAPDSVTALVDAALGVQLAA